MALSVSIELVSSSARVTSVKSQQGVSVSQSVSDGHPDPNIGPQVYLGPIKMTLTMCLKLKFYHVNFVGVCSCHKNNTRFLLEARIALAFIFSLQINTSLLPLPFFLFPEWSQFLLSKKWKKYCPNVQ